MRASHTTGSLLALVLLLILVVTVPVMCEERKLARRSVCRRRESCQNTLPAVPASPEWGPGLARRLGAAYRRLCREFYYWTVGELDGPATTTARGFCLSEVPHSWYAYSVRTERSEDLPSDLR